MKHRQVSVPGQQYEVDEQVLDAVAALNALAFPRIITTSSCQGSPGALSGKGYCGHISFAVQTFDPNGGTLSYFCFVTLRRVFPEFIDDEVQIAIQVHTKPYATMYFRNEILPVITERLRQLKDHTDGVRAFKRVRKLIRQHALKSPAGPVRPSQEQEKSGA